MGIRPPELGDGWRTAAPTSVGFNVDRLDAMTSAIRRQEYPNIHAVLIERDNRLVYETYFTGTDQRFIRSLGTVVFDRNTKHDIRSISKSVTSALLGIALASRATDQLKRPLLDFFPEHAAIAPTNWRSITLRDALTMTAGLQWDETNIPYTDPSNGEIEMDNAPDPTGYVLSRPVVTVPGTQFNYNGGLVQLVAVAIERDRRRPLRDFARQMLFTPLGITDWEWAGDLSGTPAAASGLRLRPRDLAKFGSLYLHHGRWNGRQIIPSAWVTESLRMAIDPKLKLTGLATGYGYYWWLDRVKIGSSTFEVQEAVGNGGQRIFLVPKLRLAVTTLAGRYDDPHQAIDAKRLLVEGILPALNQNQLRQ
jgi:CubicO group peptidase (beta-lactamase class C family)